MGDKDMAADGVTIRDVVRDVVAEVAPDELPVVAGLAELDEAVALRRMVRRKTRQDPLGFGLDQTVALVTPAVWLAVSEAARQLGGDAGGGIAAWVKAAVRKVLRRRAAPAVVPPLTREQAVAVRELVREMAEQRGLSKQRAIVIADAVATRLPGWDVASGDHVGHAGE
jgi:hypothetical protein